VQVFVIGIFFNNFRHRPGLNNLLRADASLYGSMKGMTTEFKVTHRINT